MLPKKQIHFLTIDIGNVTYFKGRDAVHEISIILNRDGKGIDVRPTYNLESMLELSSSSFSSSNALEQYVRDLLDKEYPGITYRHPAGTND